MATQDIASENNTPYFPRVDTPGTIATADGRYAPPQLDAAGNLRVVVATAGIPPTAAAIAAAVANPDAVTFNAPVVINAIANAYTDLGHTTFTRLHELCIKANVADTVFLYSATDNAGTGAVVLAQWTVAATGGPFYPFRKEAAGCLVVAATGKYLSLHAVTATLQGFAITSSKAT